MELGFRIEPWLKPKADSLAQPDACRWLLQGLRQTEGVAVDQLREFVG